MKLLEKCTVEFIKICVVISDEKNISIKRNTEMESKEKRGRYQSLATMTSKELVNSESSC